MRATLTTSYAICAAHRLYHPHWSEEKNRQVFGPCADLHGHQYRFEISVAGTVDPDSGMILNAFEMENIVREKVVSQVDHKYLNEAVPFFREKLPTSEWIACWVFQELKKAFPAGCELKQVRVYETPSLFADVTA